jgi:hypothetical protein
LKLSNSQGTSVSEAIPMLVLSEAPDDVLASARAELKQAELLVQRWSDVGRPVIRQFLIRTILALERKYKDAGV